MQMLEYWSVKLFGILKISILQLGMVEHEIQCDKIAIELKIIIFNLFIRFKRK